MLPNREKICMPTIRKIKPSDNEQVRSLIDTIMRQEFDAEKKAYARHDLDDPASYYGGGRDVFFVAEKNKNIIGTAAIKEDTPDTALLRRVFVKPECRGQGCGTKLIEQAVEFCAKQKYKYVTFRGSDKMRQALRLCVQAGFIRTHVIVTDDVIIFLLTKKLTPLP